MVMVVIADTAVVAAGDVGALCDQCGRYGQPRRLVVLVPLADTLNKDGDKYTKDQYKHNGEYDASYIEHLKALVKTHSETEIHETILLDCIFLSHYICIRHKRQYSQMGGIFGDIFSAFSVHSNLGYGTNKKHLHTKTRGD